mgnify:FL=1
MRDENYYKNKKAKREGKDNVSNTKGFNPLSILGFLAGLLVAGIVLSLLKK